MTEDAGSNVFRLADARNAKLAEHFTPVGTALGNAIGRIDPFMTQGRMADYFEMYAQLLLRYAATLREEPDAIVGRGRKCE